jgi:hypothetical protein
MSMALTAVMITTHLPCHFNVPNPRWVAMMHAPVAVAKSLRSAMVPQGKSINYRNPPNTPYKPKWSGIHSSLTTCYLAD